MKILSRVGAVSVLLMFVSVPVQAQVNGANLVVATGHSCVAKNPKNADRLRYTKHGVENKSTKNAYVYCQVPYQHLDANQDNQGLKVRMRIEVSTKELAWNGLTGAPIPPPSVVMFGSNITTYHAGDYITAVHQLETARSTPANYMYQFHSCDGSSYFPFFIHNPPVALVKLVPGAMVEAIYMDIVDESDPNDAAANECNVIL